MSKALFAKKTFCGGLCYLGGSELKVRSHMRDLDLDGLTLVAVAVLPAALDELAIFAGSPYLVVTNARPITDRSWANAQVRGSKRRRMRIELTHRLSTAHRF